MPVLDWSQSFSTDLAELDATHQEFVELLGAVEAADDATLMQAWHVLVEHTEWHFACEDRWMADTSFDIDNIHTVHHAMLLKVMKEASHRGRAGDLARVRQLASELGLWFPHHAQVMDAELAAHLRRVGYDTETATVQRPAELPNARAFGQTIGSALESDRPPSTAQHRTAGPA